MIYIYDGGYPERDRGGEEEEEEEEGLLQQFYKVRIYGLTKAARVAKAGASLHPAFSK